MQNLDPTYLRYIYDNLIKGSIHHDNSSELPEGLIGLYEEAFDEHIPVLQRQQLLRRFALFALLKKEVSVAFIAEVLDENEEEIIDFINTFASWFNSPEPGKFQLYHERLKVYLLQKIKINEIEYLNQTLSSFLKKGIDNQLEDEKELYALEFMIDHLIVSAWMNNFKSESDVINLVSNLEFQNRQIMFSGGFNWSKNSIKNTISYLTYEQEIKLKDNAKTIIDLGLKLVDLYYDEQNDGSTIINLITIGKTELALKRIDTFGGDSEHDQKRKFVLFLLCLFELLNNTSETISINNNINKFCKKLSDQITVKIHGELPISDEFIFELACKIDLLGIDYLQITNKIGDWDFKWIQSYSQFTDSSIAVLMSLLNNELDITNKNKGLSYLSIRLCELGKHNESLDVLDLISEDAIDNELSF